ncbi:MAG: RluA family pseudouridine synthase [Kiritimatiellae bacterium]|nr:RluA family pseudouridine synthase [Kiritimatiellia bacterium]
MAKRPMRGIRIVHEDDDVIVLEKAAGLLVQETRHGGEYTVEGALSDYVRKGQARSRKRVYLVHRLDRETSGVMMVAKTPEAEDYFRTHWNEVTEKTYLARVVGKMETPEGVYESHLAEDPDGYRVRSVANPNKGKAARTEWSVEAESGGTTLVRVALKSGRKNQIRVHFAEAGHPVVGDEKYRGPRASRLCLHAWRLAFIHPHTGRKLFFETERPAFAQPRAERRSDDSGSAR